MVILVPSKLQAPKSIKEKAMKQEFENQIKR